MEIFLALLLAVKPLHRLNKTCEIYYQKLKTLDSKLMTKTYLCRPDKNPGIFYGR